MICVSHAYAVDRISGLLGLPSKQSCKKRAVQFFFSQQSTIGTANNKKYYAFVTKQRDSVDHKPVEKIKI
jgi:hypothetical protein